MFVEVESSGAVIRSRRASPGLPAASEFFRASAKKFSFCCKRLPVKMEGGGFGFENMFYNIFSWKFLLKNLEGTIGMPNFALAFGERRFPPPPERFCGRCAIRHETRLEVAETAKAKKISRKILRIQKKFLTLQRFSPLPKRSPGKSTLKGLQ